jgi:hypothetical protein
MTLGDKMVDVSKGFMPLGVVAAIIFVAFQAGSVYTGINVAGTVTQQQVGLIQADISALKASMDSIRTSMNILPRDVLRKSDMFRFCLAAERINKNFRCPELPQSDQ